jgi:hypothetical protein
VSNRTLHIGRASSAATVLRCSKRPRAQPEHLDSVPRPSARLQVWCASNREELELRASSLAPLLPVRRSEGVQRGACQRAQQADTITAIVAGREYNCTQTHRERIAAVDGWRDELLTAMLQG